MNCCTQQIICLTSRKLDTGFWKGNYLLKLHFFWHQITASECITALWQEKKTGKRLWILKKMLDGRGQRTWINWQMEVGWYELWNMMWLTLIVWQVSFNFSNPTSAAIRLAAFLFFSTDDANNTPFTCIWHDLIMNKITDISTVLWFIKQTSM